MKKTIKSEITIVLSQEELDTILWALDKLPIKLENKEYNDSLRILNELNNILSVSEVNIRDSLETPEDL